MSSKKKRPKPRNKVNAQSVVPKKAVPSPSVGFRFSRWWKSKSPIMLYAVKFFALTALFYTLLLLPLLGHLIDRWALFSARFDCFLLNLIGEHCQTSGEVIYAPHFAITVAPACTGVELLCYFSAAILVFPAPWKNKLIGIVAGGVIISSMNFFRIVSLYVAGVHFPSLFDCIHEEVWSFILNCIVFLIFMAWMQWALSEKEQAA